MGWDFAAYFINARYFFYGGDYFEVYRAPLISFLLGIFMIFGSFSYYLYIIFVSFLFLFSVLKISDFIYENYFKKYKLSKKDFRLLFYLLLLSPFLLNFALVEGTELLGLSFFMLFLWAFLSNKISGHYLGLAFLSRYNFLIFVVFLFFSKDFKKIIKNLISFLLVIFPWFFYNFLNFGNPFVSLVDSYYLNVFSRQDIIEPFNILGLINPIGYFLIFFLLGIFLFFYFKQWKNKIFLMFFLTLILFIWEIYSIPFKVPRYMFNLVLPIAFFSFFGINFLVKKYFVLKKYFVFFLFVFFLFSTISISFVYFSFVESQETYSDSARVIEEMGFSECKILCNLWVPINYYSGNVFFLGDLDHSIRTNHTVLIFKGVTTFDDTFDMKDIDNYNKLYEEERFVFLGKENLNNETCLKRHGYDSPRISNTCDFLSKRFKFINLDKIVKTLCSLFNKK